MATIYHNPACSTSRKVLALLRDAGIGPEIVEYLQTPPSAATLRDLLGRMGLTARQLLRRKEPLYRELNLDDSGLDEPALIAAMLAHPILIERPIVVTARGARLCRPPETVHGILPKVPR